MAMAAVAQAPPPVDFIAPELKVKTKIGSLRHNATTDPQASNLALANPVAAQITVERVRVTKPLRYRYGACSRSSLRQREGGYSPLLD